MREWPLSWMVRGILGFQGSRNGVVDSLPQRPQQVERTMTVADSGGLAKCFGDEVLGGVDSGDGVIA